MTLQDLKDGLEREREERLELLAELRLEDTPDTVPAVEAVARRVADLYQPCPEGCTHERFFSPCDGAHVVASRGVCWWGREGDEFINAKALARYLFGEGT